VPRILKTNNDVKDFVREARKVKSPLKFIHYIDPFTVRARVWYEVSQKLKGLVAARSLDKKINKLVATRWGQAYISKNIIELVNKYGIEKVDIINAETGER